MPSQCIWSSISTGNAFGGDEEAHLSMLSSSKDPTGRKYDQSSSEDEVSSQELQQQKDLRYEELDKSSGLSISAEPVDGNGSQVHGWK